MILTEKRFNEFTSNLNTASISEFTFNKVRNIHKKICTIVKNIEPFVSVKFGICTDYDGLLLEGFYDEWSFYNAVNKLITAWERRYNNQNVDWIISLTEYVESGYTGGNCWGGEATHFYDTEGSFEKFEPIKLFEYLKPYEQFGSYTVFEYYGNSSNYRAQYYFLDDFIKAIDNYEQVIHVFIGLPGSGKTYFAKRYMEQFGNDNCVLLDDVSQNLILLKQKFQQKHIMITDPLLVEVSRDDICNSIKHFYPDIEIKLYWCTSEVNYCINNCKIRDDGRIISDVYISYLNSKYNYETKVREDLGDVKLQTEKMTTLSEHNQTKNIWLSISKEK